MSTLGTLRRRLFGIPSARAVFSRPGFAPAAWDTFQPVAESLMEGYHATLESSTLDQLHARLEKVDVPFQGFAYEGAGMGLAALDAVAPWRDRVTQFLDGPARHHAFPFYVGVGLAYARMRSAPEAHLGRLDPVLGWVTADGYGFHEAFFHRRRTVTNHAVPARLTPFGRRMFDQGVGRAIWFSGGADPERAHAEVVAFPGQRHRDLWAGVGLASSYGGGTTADGLRHVLEAAGSHSSEVARGAAIAAWGRHQASNQADHTDLACRVYAGRSAYDAAKVVDEALVGLPATGPNPLHAVWRDRIAQALETTHDLVPD